MEKNKNLKPNNVDTNTNAESLKEAAKALENFQPKYSFEAHLASVKASNNK